MRALASIRENTKHNTRWSTRKNTGKSTRAQERALERAIERAQVSLIASTKESKLENTVRMHQREF